MRVGLLGAVLVLAAWAGAAPQGSGDAVAEVEDVAQAVVQGPEGVAKPQPVPAMAVVEERLRASTWGDVYSLLAGTDLSSEPVLRMVQAHAALATNHNNESLCLLLGSLDAETVAAWGTWTAQFLAAGATARAHYLRGDALARMGNSEAALGELVLASTPERGVDAALALSAQGVLLAASSPREARPAFASAAAADGTLADAQANIGALQIQRREGARSAKQAFAAARALNPDFGLALHGLVWLEYVQPSGADEAYDWIEPLARLDPCLGQHPTIAANWGPILDEIPGDAEAVEQFASALLPGTTIDFRQREVVSRAPAGGPGSVFHRMGPTFNDWITPGGDKKPFERLWNQATPAEREAFTPRLRAGIVAIGERAEPLLRELEEGQLRRTSPTGMIPRIVRDVSTLTHIVTGAAAIGTAETLVGPAVALSVDAGVQHALNEQLARVSEDHDALQQFSQLGRAAVREAGGASRGPASTGGVDMHWGGIEGGDWPFEPVYGLAYELHSARSAPRPARAEEATDAR